MRKLFSIFQRNYVVYFTALLVVVLLLLLMPGLAQASVTLGEGDVSPTATVEDTLEEEDTPAAPSTEEAPAEPSPTPEPSLIPTLETPIEEGPETPLPDEVEPTVSGDSTPPVLDSGNDASVPAALEIVQGAPQAAFTNKAFLVV
jgi:hypothetical protein